MIDKKKMRKWMMDTLNEKNTNQWECPKCSHTWDLPEGIEDKHNPADPKTWVDCPKCGFPIM